MKAISVILLAGIFGSAFVEPVPAAQTGPYKERVLFSFCTNDYPACRDGARPQADMIDVHGVLYGTTESGGDTGCGCGTVFTFNPSTGTETVLHPFAGGADGEGPEAGLISVEGKLYSTTGAGGSGNCSGTGCGTVFVIDRETGKEKIVYSFAGGADGATPLAGLIDVDGFGSV